MSGAFHEPDTSSALGSYLKVWLGYSLDEEIRKEAASGGIVSATLIHLLETGQVQGALVCHSAMDGGQLGYRIFIAKSREEILSAQTSKYYDIPLIQGLKLIEEFPGKVAIVGLPSQINSISRRMAHNPVLAEKIFFRIAIFCGHNSKEELLKAVWKKKGIEESQVAQFFFRKGLWRGKMQVEMKDGTVHRFPFQDFSHYQNLHILSLDRCLNCFDHMGYYADFSTGDVWMQKVKSWGVKPSIFLARNERALKVVEEMAAAGKLKADETDRETLYRSQMRSINYHYQLSARAKLAPLFGLNVRDRINIPVKLRDLGAAFIVLLNHKISRTPWALRLFLKMPKPFLIVYVYLFKGLTHYKRSTY
jgi:coenzyme F420 hydrogenase subunit beta